MDGVRLIDTVATIVAIVLAIVGFVEIFPKHFGIVRRISVAGSLVAVFVLFFMTSHKINKIWDIATGLERERTLGEMKASDDPVAKALAATAEAVRTQCEELYTSESKDKTLAEDLAIKILKETLDRLWRDSKTNASLQVLAASIDPNEFNDDSRFAKSGYDEVLKEIALSGGNVERTYLLPESTWTTMQRLEESGFMSQSNWESVYVKMKELNLGPIVEHAKRKIHCFLAGPLSPHFGRYHFDAIIVSRGSETLFAAKRENELEIRITLKGKGPTEEWQNRLNELREQHRIAVPRYFPGESSGRSRKG